MNFFDLLAKYGKKEMEREIHRGNMGLMGIVRLKHVRDGVVLYDKEQSKNIIVDQGLNHFLNVVMGADAKITTWYVGIFKNNVTPVAGDTPATALGAAGTYGEGQDADYDVPLTNKPEYIDAPAAAKVMSNSGTPASFTMAASITVYGAFISSITAKTGTTGTLLAAKKFDTARPVIDNDILTVQYDITAASV
jgi:hypothetical protein